MVGIYKYSEDCCYGYIEGIFKADSKDVEFIEKNHLTIYLCEALGKYSEIDITFTPGMCELVSDNPNEVEILTKVTDFGYNPMQQEGFRFKNSDKLEEIRTKLCNEFDCTVEEFITRLKEQNLYENLEA